MSAGLVQAAYIVAALFFIMSLAGLSKQESARNGNYYGIAGMTIALIATIFSPDAQGFGWIIIAMVIGGAIGIFYAKKVEMTEMPELVAILHSFVGLAAVLVGYNSYLDAPEAATHAEHVIHLVEVFLGVFIGAVTFTGSIVAFGKLRGVISSSPLNLPHKHKMNLAAVVISTLLMIYFVKADGSMFALIVMTLIARCRFKCTSSQCGIHNFLVNLSILHALKRSRQMSCGQRIWHRRYCDFICTLNSLRLS